MLGGNAYGGELASLNRYFFTLLSPPKLVGERHITDNAWMYDRPSIPMRRFIPNFRAVDQGRAETL